MLWEYHGGPFKLSIFYSYTYYQYHSHDIAGIEYI